MQLAGAIFDLDGTLIDSMPLWQNVGLHFLKYRGVTVADPDALARDLRPLSMAQMADYCHLHFGLTDTPDQIIRGVNQMLERRYAEELPLLRDAGDFVKQLHKRGVRLCVATTTDRPLATALLDRLGLLPLFDFIISCAEVGVGKTSPLIYERALERLGLQKEQVLVFEDAVHAIGAAKSAGFRVIAIADDMIPECKQEIRQLADQYIRYYREFDAVRFELV